ncbi:hypothetical protein HOLleu_26731 [Holothuria leucospilota]|uniref:CCHC-type domain-containing protein n=1 Tax=Holothuria leucospilota TaxID=206669 RepID=A0A9Q1H1T1_HOLLE|nr:hypothetical protein HOLleu_26731 [Holothuria leucospilota]
MSLTVEGENGTDGAEADVGDDPEKLSKTIKALQDQLKRLQSNLPEEFISEEKPDSPLGLKVQKELKISGQIGNPGQKDKLSFVSLIHQIEGAIKKGYSEREVVAAVVKAVTPGLQLRNYLEGRSDLSPILRRLLRAHFQEKSSTELYQELCNIAQGPRETAQSFLLRCLALKERILFASKEEDAEFKYESSLVEAMFMHSVSTGLADADIRQEMKPRLLHGKLSDEELFEKLNQVVYREMERKKKMQQKHHFVTPVEVKDEPGASGSAEKKKEKKEGNSLYEEVQLLKLQVAEIHQALTSGWQNPTPQLRQRGCSKCQQANKGDTCKHCYKCGKFGHFARGCRQTGNEQGSPLRDEGR